MDVAKRDTLQRQQSSFTIETTLEGETSPFIQTRLFGQDGTVLFEQTRDVSSLSPIVDNSDAVFARLDRQHASIMTDFENGRFDDTSENTPPRPRDVVAIERCLGLLAERRVDAAALALEQLLAEDPQNAEAVALLDLSRHVADGNDADLDASRPLKEGLEAFAAGRKEAAIVLWKKCLAAQPENHRRQLLVLLSTTRSDARRKYYASQVLSGERDVLEAGMPEEVQGLLYLAQTADARADDTDPTGEVGTTRASEGTLSGAIPLENLELDEAPTSEEDVSVDVHQDREVNDSAVDIHQDQEVNDTAATNPSMSVGVATQAKKKVAAKPRGKGFPFALIAAIAVALAAGAGIFFLLRTGPASATVPPQRLNEAETLVGTGQYELAVEAYSSLISEYGEQPAAVLGRGRAKLAAGDAEGGLDDLKRAYELAPELVGLAEEIGDAYYTRSSYADAVAFYERSFTASHDSPDGRYRLAESLTRVGRSPDAIEHLERVVEREPSHGEAQLLLGELLLQVSRFEEAETALRASATRVEAGGDYFASLAAAHLGQLELDDAEEAARELRRLNPNDARGATLLGEVYLARGQFEPARAQLIQALLTDRNQPRAQLALARTWLALGRNNDDARALAKARDVLVGTNGVHDGERLSVLGQIALAEGDYEAAEDLLVQSLERDAAPLLVHLSLAECRALDDNLAGSAEALQAARLLAPEDAAITLSLAITYARQGDPHNATLAFLETLHAIGVSSPPEGDAGPIALPGSYVAVPPRFDIAQEMRRTYRAVLTEQAEDASAQELESLTAGARFVLGTRPGR